MAYDYYVRAYMGENLESMPDYATALNIYNARKPYIKGKYKGERPLGRNRRHDRSRIELDAHGNIRVKHWQTDIIVYKPDGEIQLSSGGWSSISTAQIMQELLGVDRVCRVNCKIYYRHNDEFHYLGGGLYIKSDGSPLFVNHEHVHKIKPHVLKALRKKYGFFLEYAKQVLTMSSEFEVGYTNARFNAPDFEGETLQGWYMTPLITGATTRHDTQAKAKASDVLFGYLDSLAEKPEDERLQAMYELLAPVTYMLSNDRYRFLNAGIKWSCNYQRFKRGFDEMLKHQFNHELFRLDIASKKSPVRDPNAKYMV